MDRDISLLLYLNDEYEGGELLRGRSGASRYNRRTSARPFDWPGFTAAVRDPAGPAHGVRRQMLRSIRCILAVTASLAPLLAGKAAFAQTDAERLEALRGCLGIESDAARLLCFESIVSAEPDAGTTANARVEPTAEAERPGSPGASETADGTSEHLAADREQPPPATAEPAGIDAVAAADVSTVDESAAATIPVEDGASQSRRNADDAFAVDETETLVIVETGALRRGNATFLTDDGRLFVQTSGPTSRNLPSVPFEATLEDGAFGSVFLVAPSARLRIRVAEPTD